jgi:hypothetical protein
MAIEINDNSPVERARIEDYFSEPAVIVSESRYAGGRLTIWKNALSLPSRKACTIVNSRGEVIIPNSDEKTFTKAFADLKPDLADVENISGLIRSMSPSLRKSILRLQPYMEKIASIWHVPRFEGDCFQGFFDNSTSGTIERIVIQKDFRVTVEYVGSGVRFDLL